MSFWKVGLSYLFTIALAAVVIAGPFVLLTSMSSPVSDCFFMPHEEVLCDMSTLEHIEHWQSTFTYTVIKAVTTLGLAAVALFLLWEHVRPRQSLQFIRVHAPPKPTLFEELFSQGLLNSKAY